MAPKTRLDPLVRMRERGEDHALESLARAQQALSRTRDRLRAMNERAAADGRGAGEAAMWAVEESAHARAMQDARAVERELAQAHGAERAARAAYERAWRDAEATRRLREKLRQDLLQDAQKREQRALDELATQGFNGKR